MSVELKLEIRTMDEATAKLILSCASAWGCTPEEAAARLLSGIAAKAY